MSREVHSNQRLFEYDFLIGFQYSSVNPLVNKADRIGFHNVTCMNMTPFQINWKCPGGLPRKTSHDTTYVDVEKVVSEFFVES